MLRQAEWQAEKEEKVRRLQEQYDASVNQVGEGHQEALENVSPLILKSESIVIMFKADRSGEQCLMHHSCQKLFFIWKYHSNVYETEVDSIKVNCLTLYSYLKGILIHPLIMGLTSCTNEILVNFFPVRSHELRIVSWQPLLTAVKQRNVTLPP